MEHLFSEPDAPEINDKLVRQFTPLSAYFKRCDVEFITLLAKPDTSYVAKGVPFPQSVYALQNATSFFSKQDNFLFNAIANIYNCETWVAHTRELYLLRMKCGRVRKYEIFFFNGVIFAIRCFQEKRI